MICKGAGSTHQALAVHFDDLVVDLNAAVPCSGTAVCDGLHEYAQLLQPSISPYAHA